MALAYDDIPGSWGLHSQNWPMIRTTRENARMAHAFCVKCPDIPYGSYVLMDNEIRLETEAQKAIVQRYLDSLEAKAA